MDQLKILLQADTSTNKPKKIKNNQGKFTGSFLKWNKKQIKEGKTSFYADTDYLYGLKTNKIKKKTSMTTAFKNKINIFQSTFAPKDTNALNFTYTYKTTTFIGDQGYSYIDNDLKNNFLLRNLIQDNGIIGNYRLILKIGEEQIIDLNDTLNVPWFDKNIDTFRSGSAYMVWNDPEEIGEGEKVTFIFTKETLLPFKFYSQKFLDGANHCVFYPINEYMTTQLEESKSKSTKSNYQSKINLIMGKKLKTGEIKMGLMEQYKTGVPEKDIPEVCEKLQIGIDILQPFNDNKLFEYRSNKKPLKVFKFVNSRLNHIERNERPIQRDTIYKSYDPICVSPQELQTIHDNARDNNEFMIFNKNLYGISSIRTLNNFYRLDSSFSSTYAKWEADMGLDRCYIDYNKYPVLGNFIQNGIHFNGTVDFLDTSEYKDKPEGERSIPKFFKETVAGKQYVETFEKNNIPKNMRHIDMTKAYTQFKQSKFYNGFMGKITDFREVDNYEEKGLYYITNINLDNCSEKFRELQKTLYWFQNDNIYTDVELTALTHYGGKFDVTHGCFGTKIDFEFSEDMTHKKDDCRITDKIKPIPFYSKWTGLKSATFNFNSFFMYGEEGYFNTIQDSTENKIFYNEKEKTGRIQTNNKYKFSIKHIPAQILAYQRLIMLDQLLQMDISKVQRVCVDGIYYLDHKFEMLKPFAPKTDMTFNNAPCNSYLSNILDNEFIGNIELPEAKSRKHYETELFLGAGGNGKTYHNLTDMGFINLVYVGHSWKLATGMRNNHGVNVSVHNRLFSFNYMKDTFTYNNVLVIDECSMITELQKQDIINKCKDYGSKVIFCGDIGYQLPPIEDTKEMTTKNIDNIIELKTNYRFKCDKLINLLKNVRKQIESPEGNYFRMSDLIKYQKYGNFIKTEELKKLYKKEDMILTYTKKNRYCELFEDIEKYKIKNNTRQYKNGEIAYKKPTLGGIEYEKRHGFTTHSIQGETFEKNIFIDYQQVCNNTFGNVLRLFYTAVSRARYMNQIYFVIPDHF